MSGAVIRGRLCTFFFLLPTTAINSLSHANNYPTVISMNTTGWPHCRKTRMGARPHHLGERTTEERARPEIFPVTVLAIPYRLLLL